MRTRSFRYEQYIPPDGDADCVSVHLAYNGFTHVISMALLKAPSLTMFNSKLF